VSRRECGDCRHKKLTDRSQLKSKTNPSNYSTTKETQSQKFTEKNLHNPHGLYWFWRNEQKKEVAVITCFRADPVF